MFIFYQTSQTLTNPINTLILAGPPEAGSMEAVLRGTSSLKRRMLFSIRPAQTTGWGKGYMLSVLILLAGIAAVMLFGALKQTKQLKAKLVKKLPPVQFLPKAISLLLVTAQASELVKMVEHVSIVTVAASLLLLAIVIAARSGTENRLH